MKDCQGLIFIVDDDPPVLKGLSRLLRGRGFQVRTFASAEAFLGALGAEAPACLLLDMRMPGMDGLDLMDALARRGVETPVVVITAYLDDGLARRCKAAGASACLTKPVEPSALLQAIAAARSGAGMSRAPNWRRRHQ